MISEDQLKRVAAWSRELTEREIEVARGGITERSYGTGETVFMRGDKFDYWAGMVSGLMTWKLELVEQCSEAGQQQRDYHRLPEGDPSL